MSRKSSSAKIDAVLEEGWPSEPPTGVRTPLPPFDVEAFAADSEFRLRACAEAERKSTAPPPPFHPSGFPAAVSHGGAGSSAPAMADCARRVELTRAALRIGGMSRDEAARVLRAELARVEEDGGPSDAVCTLTSTLSAAVAELGGIAEERHPSERSILVLDDSVELRDKLTIALEALGHSVRIGAKSGPLAELTAHDVAAVIVGVDAGCGSAGWQLLHELLPLEGVAIIMGGRNGGPGLETLAAEAGAVDFVRFDLAIHELIDALSTVLTALGLARTPSTELF